MEIIWLIHDEQSNIEYFLLPRHRCLWICMARGDILRYPGTRVGDSLDFNYLHS